MKKLISALLAVATLLLLTSCTGKIEITDSAYYTDYDGVYITIDSVEGEENEQQLVTTWHNESDKVVVFGYAYSIEYSKDGEWEEVLKKDFAVIEMACVVEPQDVAVMNYKTEYFNLSREGTYRLIVEFYVQTDIVSTTHATTYAEFSVKK